MQSHGLKDFIVDECVDGVLVRGGGCCAIVSSGFERLADVKE